MIYFTKHVFAILSATLLVSAVPLQTKRQDFALSNGQAAQNLNAQFEGLTADSDCSGDACVNGAFAQCVNGKFVLSPCAGGLQCFALPLVNSAGTSVTCDTEADATTRVANTGATGGLNGRSFDERADFTLSNGQDAQQKNADNADLTADSSCNTGDTACVDGDFAQCVDGKFVTTPCAATEQCVVLPLVNSKGTSTTCDTLADAQSRIADTGVSGGLTGRDLPPRSTLAARALKARDTPTPPPACEAKKRKRSGFSKRRELTIAKRIAQTDLGAVAQSWQDLCEASGGDIATNTPCVTLAGVNGINALLANADPCAQQVNADAMVTFAKSAGVTNGDALIANAKTYLAHPRNALDLGGFTPSTPFCTNGPENSELDGIFHGQLDGVDPGLFGGPAFAVVAFGAAGTCPFGQTADVDTCTCS